MSALLIDQQVAVLELSEEARSQGERDIVSAWAKEYGVEETLLPWVGSKVAKAIRKSKPVLELKQLARDERRFARFEDINPKLAKKQRSEQRRSGRMYKEANYV